MVRVESRVENPLEALLMDTQQVKEGGEIRIFTGNLVEFNDPRFAQVLESVKKERSTTKLSIITGPILLTDDEGYNGILTLHKKGLVDQLIHEPTFGCGPYHHLIETFEDLIFYLAQYGSIITPLEERSGAAGNFGQGVYDMFYSAEARWRYFDNSIEMYRKEFFKVPGYEKLPLVTTMDNLKLLFELDNQRRGPHAQLIYLDPEKILELPGAQGLLHTHH